MELCGGANSWRFDARQAHPLSYRPPGFETQERAGPRKLPEIWFQEEGCREAQAEKETQKEQGVINALDTPGGTTCFCAIK